MSNAKEIRTKIKSIKNTQKITRAMEMVAASKMRKAQERMFTSRPYAERILNVIGHLANAHPEYQHPFLQQREIKRAGFIVVTTDRGLCGGLNVNLLRTTVAAMSEWKKKGVDLDIGIVGKKGETFFKRFGGNVVAQVERLGYSPRIMDFIGIVKVMLDAYYEGRLDAVFISYNRFVNRMIQKPHLQRLLPTVPETSEKLKHVWDYIYEPDARELLDKLLERYIETQVYQAVVENIACEQAARMVSMRSASENAGELINKLQLVYNKARQAAITKELSEIVAGAAAV